jgi:alkylated DNA repair protein (DNA oxidative demethylase)
MARELSGDLFGAAPEPPLPPGFILERGYLDGTAQRALRDGVLAVIAEAPLFQPTMPKTGKPLSARMTNCGPLGWVSDAAGGYRYQKTHPVTGKPWPPMPAMLLDMWRALTDYPAPPEACLINSYDDTARMGLHRDVDEEDFSAPVISVSLGDDALFRLGGAERSAPTQSFRLKSGDVVLLGGAARLFFHGVDRIYPGTSSLLPEVGPSPAEALVRGDPKASASARVGGRINLTLRRVTKPMAAA